MTINIMSHGRCFLLVWNVLVVKLHRPHSMILLLHKRGHDFLPFISFVVEPKMALKMIVFGLTLVECWQEVVVAGKLDILTIKTQLLLH